MKRGRQLRAQAASINYQWSLAHALTYSTINPQGQTSGQTAEGPEIVWERLGKVMPRLQVRVSHLTRESEINMKFYVETKIVVKQTDRQTKEQPRIFSAIKKTTQFYLYAIDKHLQERSWGGRMWGPFAPMLHDRDRLQLFQEDDWEKKQKYRNTSTAFLSPPRYPCRDWRFCNQNVLKAQVVSIVFMPT